VRKLKVVAFLETSKVFMRHVASGYTHGEVVREVGSEIRNAAMPYSNPPQDFVSTGTDGMYGIAFNSRLSLQKLLM
jgi:hypothetical protein